jgi:hypothetical protein
VVSVEPFDIYGVRNLLSQKYIVKAHTSHMKPLDVSRYTPAQQLKICLDSGEQIAHAILGHKTVGGALSFQVQWDVVGLMETSWEHPEVLSKLDVFKEYIVSQGLKSEVDKMLRNRSKSYRSNPPFSLFLSISDDAHIKFLIFVVK